MRKKQGIRRKIVEALKAHPLRANVRKLSLFGSYAHGKPDKKSDVDLLVEFTGSVGLFALSRMQCDLEKALGVPVDLVTSGFLSKYFRQEVIDSAETLYEIR